METENKNQNPIPDKDFNPKNAWHWLGFLRILVQWIISIIKSFKK